MTMKKLVLLSTVVLLGLSACLAESQNNWFDQSQDHVNHETSETTHSSHSKEEETSESSESNESSNSSEFRESSESSTEETVDPVDAILNGDYSSLVGVWDYPDGSSFKQADIVTVVLPDGYRLKVDSNGNTRGVEQLIGASEAIQSVIYFRNSTKTEKVDVIKLSVVSGFMGAGGYVPLLYPAGWQVGNTDSTRDRMAGTQNGTPAENAYCQFKISDDVSQYENCSRLVSYNYSTPYIYILGSYQASDGSSIAVVDYDSDLLEDVTNGRYIGSFDVDNSQPLTTSYQKVGDYLYYPFEVTLEGGNEYNALFLIPRGQVAGKTDTSQDRLIIGNTGDLSFSKIPADKVFYKISERTNY